MGDIEILQRMNFPMAIDATVGVERHWREDDDEGRTLEEANRIEKCKGVLMPPPVGDTDIVEPHRTQVKRLSSRSARCHSSRLNETANDGREFSYRW